jgi:hypothetical protein
MAGQNGSEDGVPHGPRMEFVATKAVVAEGPGSGFQRYVCSAGLSWKVRESDCEALMTHAGRVRVLESPMAGIRSIRLASIR